MSPSFCIPLSHAGNTRRRTEKTVNRRPLPFNFRLGSMAGCLRFKCGLCPESDMPFLERYFQGLKHSCEINDSYDIQCDDCDIWFPCKAFLMLPFWHNPGCRLRTDESSKSVYVTISGQIILFDRKEIQDANSPRTATCKGAFQLGGSISFNEEPWRRMLQEARGSECPYPTPISSHESLQAEKHARHREGLPIYADTAGFQLGGSVSFTEDSWRNVPHDGGESCDLFPTSASFQPSLRAQESAQASSEPVLYSCAVDESTSRGTEIAIVAARSVNAENTDLRRRNMYGCDTCGELFPSSKGVETHTRSSACNSQKKCRLCDFECETYEDLDEHGELVHKGKYEYMYMCPLCNKEFKKRNSLTYHHKLQHR